MAGKKPQRLETTYSYAAVETALAGIFGADQDVQRGAFRGRLKHFQRLGLPGIESGKGTRISYSGEIASQWLVGLLMAEVGIDPILIVRIIETRWKYLEVGRATDAIATAPVKPNQVYLGLRPRLMSGAWAGGKANPKTMEWISTFRRYDAHGNENIGLALDREGWFCARNLTVPLVKLQVGLQDHANPAGDA